MLSGIRLRRLGPDRFETGPVVVVFDRSGNSVKTAISLNGETLFAGTRVEPLRLSAAALAAYVGAYKSIELDATYRLSVDGGGPRNAGVREGRE